MGQNGQKPELGSRLGKGGALLIMEIIKHEHRQNANIPSS